jgi:hypothetical protein
MPGLACSNACESPGIVWTARSTTYRIGRVNQDLRMTECLERWLPRRERRPVVVVRHVTEEGGLDVACMVNHVHSESKAIGREDEEKREIASAIIKNMGACSRVRHEANAVKTLLKA